MSACLDDDALAAELERSGGVLGEGLQQHVDGCASCRRLVVSLAMIRTPETSIPVAVRDLPLPRGAVVARYVISGIAGVGAMGVVYAAYDPELDRKVAIKLLHPAPDRDAGELVRREAQAMARLTHPNVLTVHDVGTHDDRTFVTMELIDGESLDEWQARETRAWRVTLAAYLAAGRGLASAHAAGVLHRDFKPANVMRAKDGRVVVGDFGLARMEPGAAKELAGTPRYMAPEVVAGHEPTAASDQFSFCVALYRALYGEHPFPEDPARAGELVPARAGARVPGWVRRRVVRGLAVDPAARYPSVAALVDDLERARSVRERSRVLVLAGIAVLLLVGALTLRMLTAEPAPQVASCGGHDRAARVWNADRKTVVREAMLAAGTPMAADAWRSVERRLDRYVGEWAAMHRNACEATHKRGEQSEALLDLRMRCLSHRLEEVAALTTMLAHPDAELIGRASRAAQAAGRLEACADTEALLAPTPLPSAPNVRASVEALRTRLAANLALGHAARYKEQLAELEHLVPEAEQLGYAPLIGEARFAHATALGRSADFARAADVMRAAGYAADEGGDRKLAARVRAELVWLVGHEQSDTRRGLEYADDAAARIKGLGGDAELEGLLASNYSTVLDNAGRIADGTEQARIAMERRIAAFGADDVQTAISRVNYAVGMARMGKVRDAIALYERSLATYREALGENHPLYAHTLFNIADSQREIGQYAEARRTATRSLEIIVRVLGPEHNLVASAENVLGLIAIAELRWDEAEAHLRRALALCEKLRGRQHLFTAHYALTLASVRTQQGDAREGLALAQRAFAIFQNHDNRAGLVRATAGVAEARAALGERRPAIEQLEGILVHADTVAKEDPVAVSLARFMLARLLVETPATAARAKELAAQALVGADAPARTEIAAWQARHP